MKYTDLRKKIKTPSFSLQDLRLAGAKVFDYQFSQWQKQGHIIKIKNGLYIFKDQIKNIAPEEIAGKIYSPSYISLEKALSIYGIIPEIVYSLTSVTSKTTREFKNQMGHFSYRHIKPSLFFGYKEIKATTGKYLLAEPEKALLDFIYLNQEKIKNNRDIESFRFKKEIIKKDLSLSKIEEYLKSYKNKKIQETIKFLLKGK